MPSSISRRQALQLIGAGVAGVSLPQALARTEAKRAPAKAASRS